MPRTTHEGITLDPTCTTEVSPSQQFLDSETLTRLDEGLAGVVVSLDDLAFGQEKDCLDDYAPSAKTLKENAETIRQVRAFIRALMNGV